MRCGGRYRVAVLMAVDALGLFVVWLFTLWAYRELGFGRYKFGLDFYLSLWPAVLAFLALNAMFRLYHGNPMYPSAPLPPVEEMRRLFGSSIITHLGIIAYLALAYQTTEHYSRAVIVISGLLTAFLSQSFRDLARHILHRAGVFQIRVFVVGGDQSRRRLEDFFAGDSHFGFKVVGSLDDSSSIRDIVPEAKKAKVKILVCASDPRLFGCVLGDFASWFTHVIYIPSYATFPVHGAQPLALDGVGALEMVNQRRMGALRLQKRILDKSLSVIAFVLLSPFFIIIPLLIKATSRGPVFYRQNRLGRLGKPIRVWKFRSMYADADSRLAALLESDPAKRAEWQATFKLSQDPRVTPLGRFLRKTSIDEFPQLFNVFTGDMALVGPRPIVQAEVEKYGAAYATFSSVEPGVTGLWQASGRSDTDYARRVALDTYYVLNWSPWMDLWIMKKTVGAVLFMRGAC